MPSRREKAKWQGGIVIADNHGYKKQGGRDRASFDMCFGKFSITSLPWK
jgi:hypothetical protein